ncbi:cilia- and flagella-associated protein 251-like [Clytia hemisphaerica]|uniref:cilia- and flagella-associated protein 251-like n=1 Tax=Clytia hemisphaerica TaxID=252671 RepID=UPI0034D52E65
MQILLKEAGRVEVEGRDEEGAKVEGRDEEGAEVEDSDEQGAEVEDRDEQGAEVEDRDEEGAEVEDRDEEGAEVEDRDEQGAEVEDRDEQGAEVEDRDEEGAEHPDSSQMTSNRQRNTPNLLCTGNACADDKNEDTLACSKSAELSKLKETIKENENTIKKLKTNKHHLIVETHKEELSQLKKNLSDDPAFHTVEYVENKLEKKLEDFRTEILSTIKEEQKKSYAAAASAGTSAPSNDNIKTAVKQVHEEEAAEEKDKSRRSNNIIIHGVKESTEDPNKEDEDWVKELIENLRVKINTKHMMRLGSKADNKSRPILVTFKSEKEKESLFGNLHVLKGNAKYKGVSICEDLTPTQRKDFKDLLQEAKERNQSETDEVWRVRGSSKNGFHLKRVKTNGPNQQ